MKSNKSIFRRKKALFCQEWLQMMKTALLTTVILLLPHVLLGQGSVMLVGGGRDDYRSWSDEPYGWFVQQADSGIVINIDADEVSSFYPEYFCWLGADENSHSLRIRNTATANDSATYLDLVSASGIFIEGGDQWDYVSNWKGTLVEDAIHQVFERGGAIGGTSAGLAILGDIIIDAMYGTAHPSTIAYNPYHHSIHFTDDFIDILPRVIPDSHFQERARLGRLIPALARRIQDHGEAGLIGIGVDAYSALCIGQDLVARAYGECVTVLSRSDESYIHCETGRPPTFTHINFDQLIHGAVYDLNTRSLIDPGPYLMPVEGTLPPAVFTGVTLNGSEEGTADYGEIVITNLTSDEDNWWRGRLGEQAGSATVPHSIIMPRLWSESDYSPNRLIGAEFGLVNHPRFTAIYLDDGGQATISSEGTLIVSGMAYILDTHAATHAGINTFNFKAPGIIGAKLHFLGDGDVYNLLEHSSPVAVSGERGDVDGNGLINMLDVLAVVRHILGIDHLQEKLHRAADCSGDGTINIVDVLGIVNLILGLGECAPGDCHSSLTAQGWELLASLSRDLTGQEYATLMAMVIQEGTIPQEHVLLTNYPNPFNSQTTITYTLPVQSGELRVRGGEGTLNSEPFTSHVTLKIFNVLGQEVRTLVDGIMEPGLHTVAWDGTDHGGCDAPSGIYFVRLTYSLDQAPAVQRVVLLR